MSKADLSKLFLRKTIKWDSGLIVRPVDQAPDRSVRESFSRSIHGKKVASIKSYWQKMIFSVRSTPPPELETERGVMEYVRENSGAIGYVSAGASIGSGVKVLRITD